MRKLLLIIFLFIFSRESHSQVSDFLQLKKNEKVAKTYWPGLRINFIARGNYEVEGIISQMKNDTVFLKQYDARMVPTGYGTFRPDTIRVFESAFYYKDIVAIPKKSKGFVYIRNGALLMIAGVGYAALHSINALYHKDVVDGKEMAIAGAVAATGLLMNKTYKTSYEIGRKYHLNYVRMNIPVK